MINESVKKVLDEAGLWYIATCGEDPHNVPVGFKTVLPDGKLAIGVAMLKKTVENIKANGKVAITAAAGMEAYEILGTAEFVTEGPVFDSFVKMAEVVFKGAISVKCAMIVTPCKITNLSANQHNNEVVA